ncbi:uncharacterized protein LOC119601507 [Lucilia sericata]|uniref:uncharacterized protein LOC119601507 n=1 Tax=Lucilia sericata TaxID=13632 RepID=UPI0018A840DB|nr:uncharacterized protein LOC119601507 [Lucilia sericata]
MQFLKVVAFLNLLVVCMSAETYSNSTQVLSRRKRYIAFPDGSSVSAAICLTIGVVGNPHVDYLSWAVNWGVAYNLPNYAWARKHAQGFSNITKAIIQRRSRRELFEKLELMIDNMGFSGNTCIARALCESAQILQHLRQRRGNMVEEIVKTIFSLPTAPVEYHEPEKHHLYDRLYRRAKRSEINCAVEYSSCRFSLLEMALGKYSVGSTKLSPGFVFM